MSSDANDMRVLEQAQAAVEAAGAAIMERFSPDARPIDRRDIGARIGANDAISMNILRPALEVALPGSRVIEDELAAGSLGQGAFWIVDPVEGAVNHVHGIPDWCISATLIRDDALVLTVVVLPCFGQTYTALAGHGAWLNGAPMRVSQKPEMNGAMVGTGQAAPGESAAVLASIGASVTAMLNVALTVRVSVPATLQLVQVAAGRSEGFWQNSRVLSGLAAGALLVREAGGKVTDIAGASWGPISRNFLAAPPQLSADMSAVLSKLDI